MPHLRNFGVALGLSFCSVACTNSASRSNVTLPSFDDVFQAPPAIQRAAQAVVKISIADGMATGSFISSDGLLLTNNHVLGVDECFREGCYAQIQRMYQRHATPGAAETIYVVPQAVDIGSDIALVQAYYASSPGTKLDTPDFLQISPASADSLVGTHVNIVGHPEGVLKKWTSGPIVETDGNWVFVDAFILPGNSGSPILTDDGVMVGIIHRAPTSQDMSTGVGIDEFAIGTAAAAFSSEITTALSSGPQLPPSMLSKSATMTDDEVAAAEEVFLNSQVTSATVGGASQPVITSLGIACDEALARTSYDSPEALASILSPCLAGVSWINCQSGSGGSCPSNATDAQAWLTRYTQVYSELQALNGQLDLDMVTAGPAGLQTSQSSAETVATQGLTQALAAAQPPLDFTIAAYCATYGVFSYNGKNIADFVTSYSSVPDYGIQGTNIVVAAMYLNAATPQQLSQQAVIDLLSRLAADPNIELGTKLYIEKIQFDSKLID